MEKITILDTGIGSTNKGDEIIMRCVLEEMEYLFQRYYILHAATHLRNFSMIECMGNLPDSANEIYNSKYKFVGGTNLLSSNMFHRSNQWDINLLSCKPFFNCILIGVGSLTGEKLNTYTKKLYKRVLSKEYIHSVRESKALKILEDNGFRALNTGCVTLWKLNDNFCKTIPINKSNKVIFTLTDYRKDYEKDVRMIDIIRKNYSDIFFWVQGVHDLEYLESLTNIEDITVIEPTVKAYEDILSDNIDYIGTRLHAGIFALRNRSRSIIVGVDNRMSSMQQCIKNNFILRNDIDNLDQMINLPLYTKVDIDWKAIETWKGQFK